MTKAVTLFIAKTEEVLKFDYTDETTVKDVKGHVKVIVGIKRSEMELIHMGKTLEDESVLIKDLNFDAAPYILVHMRSSGRHEKRKNAKVDGLQVNGLKAKKYKTMLETNSEYFGIVVRELAGGDPDVMETLIKTQNNWMKMLHIDTDKVAKLRSMEITDNLPHSAEFTKRFAKYPVNSMNLATGEHVAVGEVGPDSDEDETIELEIKKSESSSDDEDSILPAELLMRLLGLRGPV